MNHATYTLFKKAFIASLKLFKKSYYTYFLEENLEKIHYLDLNDHQKYFKFATIILSIKNSNNDQIKQIVFEGAEENNELLSYFIHYFANIPRNMFMTEIRKTPKNNFKLSILNLNHIESYYEEYQHALLLQRIKNKFN